MFELSVALKYLTPRWKQLSVSIISLISILVISLVVWLIVVFFSVAYGLEKGWTHKLIAMTAPVRITPTEDYYHSYYYQIDSISANS
ncbi:MAG: ABC transporter permease, partial [Chlamydiales bacterium]|nr:ABC transporter permease [Chlamydiales bacterium]